MSALFGTKTALICAATGKKNPLIQLEFKKTDTDIYSIWYRIARGSFRGFLGFPETPTDWAGLYIPEDYSLRYSTSHYTLTLIFLTQRYMN